MSKIDLLPCPFCGKLETLRMIYLPAEKCECVYHVVCDAVSGGCGASTGWNHETPEEAAKEWNTRASGWIPCSKRMPEKAGKPGAFCAKYLIMTKFGITEGWFNPDFDCWFALVWFYTSRFLEEEISMERAYVPKVCRLPKSCVTHWRRFPDSPHGGGTYEKD